MSSFPVSYAARAVRIGALALLVGSPLVANLANLAGLLRTNPAPNDEIARRDRRFELLRNSLPTRGTVGYVSDAADVAESQRRLMLAQFALTPLILESGTDRHMIVGDFSESDVVALSRQLNLTVLRDFGDGVALFARAPR